MSRSTTFLAVLAIAAAQFAFARPELANGQSYLIPLPPSPTGGLSAGEGVVEPTPANAHTGAFTRLSDAQADPSSASPPRPVQMALVPPSGDKSLTWRQQPNPPSPHDSLTPMPSVPASMMDLSGGPTQITALPDGNPCSQDNCSGCGSCGIAACDVWPHTTSFWSSVLYVRPRNADIAYGVPIDGPIGSPPSNNPIQVGPVGQVDPDYDVGFDVGMNLAITPMASVIAELMMLDTTTSNAIDTAAPDVIRSLVSHPSSTSAATDFLTGAARLDFELDTVDVAVRHLFVGGERFAVNYLLGARYGRLQQRFNASFVDNGTEQVRTDIDFDGVGFRMGLEAERHTCQRSVRLYASGNATMLAGRFRGSYFQGQTFDPTVVETNWEAGRVVPVLDLELGAGWVSPGGRLRITTGYLVSAWLNTVRTQEWIEAVQQNDFTSLDDALSFDGLRGQVEWRF